VLAVRTSGPTVQTHAEYRHRTTTLVTRGRRAPLHRAGGMVESNAWENRPCGSDRPATCAIQGRMNQLR